MDISETLDFISHPMLLQKFKVVSLNQKEKIYLEKFNQ